MKSNNANIRIFLLGVFALVSLWVYPLNNNGFEPIGVKEGLNNGTIYDVIRGKNGFIWTSTDMGISRYDGFRFRNFPLILQADSSNVSSQHLPKSVQRLYEEEDNLLYLLLSKGGMACFDMTKERYLPIHFNRPFNEQKIKSLCIVEKNVLYIATAEGLFYADIERVKKDDQEAIHVNLSDVPLVKGSISLLRGDDKGNLFYCIDERTVVHYSMGTRQIRTIGAEQDQPVSTLHVSGDYLWVCRNWKDVACYDYKRNTYRSLPYTAAGLSLSDTHITEITHADDCTYYFSTRAGLFCIKFSSNALNTSPYTIENLTERLGTSYGVETRMTSLMWDQSQNTLWTGTFGGGLLRLCFNQKSYNRIVQQLNTDINAIVEDSKGYIWLATERKGVWKSNSTSPAASTTFSPWTTGVNSSESYQMYKDKNGNLWLGDEHATVIQIDPITGDAKQYPLNPQHTKGFSGNARQFCLDSREQLWIATTQGVVILDYKTGQSQLVIKSDSRMTDFLAIAEDKEGDMWVGTNMGLKRINQQAEKMMLEGEYEQQAGLPLTPASSIYVNSYNQIFVSYTDKIIRIDGRQKDKVEHLFTLNNGLNSGQILCMIDDNNGNTWVGSNSGIMTIRNDHTSFYNYSAFGYCNNVCRLRDGRLVWSDSWGLLFFDPMAVKRRQNREALLLSDLWVNEQPVAVGQEINGQVVLHATPSEQQEFVFDAANNNFSFFFSDMQYGDIMQRKIAYRLLPDSEEWQITTLEAGIHFSQLKSGDYTLQVKMVYPDASEDKILEVPIVVKEYWWLSIWAFIGYLLIAATVGFTLYWHHSFCGKKKKQQPAEHQPTEVEATEPKVTELEVIAQETNQVMDQARNIISIRFMQELRTPLSMIIAPLREVLQEKELSKGLSTKMLVAYRNSMGMLNACDQLLNIYGYRADQQVKLAPYSISSFLDTIVFSMNEFLRVHPIQFQYEKKTKKELEVWVDKKSIELVIHNMLSNAFAHIRYTGAVALIAQECVEEGVHYCSISVADNGKGEVKSIESLKMDVDSLMQIDSAEVELGYEVMEDIMKQHHGTVWMESMKDGGTRIQIKWPVDKAVFEQDAHIEFIDPEQQEELVEPEGRSSIKTSELDEDLMMMEEEATVTQGRTRKTILVIEDYKDIRFYLKTLFDSEYNVLLAENGEEGVKIARKELPDLIISDIMMPIKDGFECCKEIKEGLDTCHIPVILLTAKIEDNDIIKGLEIGADDYILKPFMPKILKVKVKNLIEGRINLKRMYTKLLVTPPEENATATPNENKSGIDDPFISTVVKIIEENIQEADFNVKKLASDLNMSQPTLYRKVKQCTDFTVIELIRGVRMRKAATLLKNRQYPVQEVAEMVGYNDIPTFRKHFVDTYGTTPSTFADSPNAGAEGV